MSHTHECYGTMFPDVLNLPPDRTISGKIFTVRIDRAGGLLRSRRTIKSDHKAWTACTQCEAFNDCYKFSMAKMSLTTAIVSQ